MGIDYVVDLACNAKRALGTEGLSDYLKTTTFASLNVPAAQNSRFWS